MFSTRTPVILSEAPSRSIEKRTAYGAESKDLGDACWQMFFQAFQPRTATDLPSSQRLFGADWKRYPPLCHPDPDFLPRCAGQGRVCAFL
jgi:hypothetical protein